MDDIPGREHINLVYKFLKLDKAHKAGAHACFLVHSTHQPPLRRFPSRLVWPFPISGAEKVAACRKKKPATSLKWPNSTPNIYVPKYTKVRNIQSKTHFIAKSPTIIAATCPAHRTVCM